jgi:hypothetical protein
MEVYANGTNAFTLVAVNAGANADDVEEMGSGMVRVSAGQTIQIKIGQTSGITLSTNSQSFVNQVHIVKVSE